MPRDLLRVTEVLRLAGLIDATWYTDETATRGRYVHEACALLDSGELDEATLDPVLRPYLGAYQKFLAECRVEWEAIEQPVEDALYGYRGTPDRVGMINGKRTVLDIKSGAMQPWTALQTAAYSACLGNRLVRFGLELRADGTYRLTEFTDRRDVAVWQGALLVAQWKQRNA